MGQNTIRRATRNLTAGTVFKKGLGQYHLKTDRGIVVCSISSKLRKQLIYPEADPQSIRPSVVSVREIRAVDPVAIGDRVEFAGSTDYSGMILRVLPRRNKFSRRASGRKPIEQVIAANLDQVVVVISTAQPPPNWGLLDRFLLAAEATELPCLICITKADLIAGSIIVGEFEVYERIGYPNITTSALSGEGLEGLKNLLHGRISVLVGKSGVGKTTLLNAIQPGLGLRVRELSESTGKGRHTTSHMEMFDLEFGGTVIDTPGIREFEPWRKDGQNVTDLFPEMRKYIGLCRFGATCSHTHEPGCAIKEAVENELIATRRYRSYLQLL